MAVIVEDGTEIANANSYVSVSEATTYLALIGETDWTTRSDLQDRAVIRATEAVDMIYGAAYRSSKKTSTQTLLFPRHAFTNANGITVSSLTIPDDLKKAVYHLALMDLQGEDTGEQLIQEDSPNSIIESESNTIGGLSSDVTYKIANEINKFRKIDLIIRAIVRSSGQHFVR